MTNTMKKSEAEGLPVEESIDVSAVMPCLNEERTLPLCIEKAQRAFREMGIRGEVVVADNGSTDHSVKIAEEMGARVVHESRKGYGAALMAGIEGARGRIVVMGDSDDSYDWSEIDGFVKKIDDGFDLVMGNRFQGGIEPGAMPALHRYLGNPVLSALARYLYRIPVGDFHCGMRAFDRASYAKVGTQAPGMEFATEMIVRAAQFGLRITEIPTRLHPDKRDRPPHLRSFRDGWRHMRFMVTYAPDTLYLTPGLTMLAIGLAGICFLAGGPRVISGLPMGIHFLAVFSLLTLLGANIIGFGLFAKLLDASRCPIRPNSILGSLLRVFTLERGLILGFLATASGLAIDTLIFIEWLARDRGAMDETVHPAFVATTILVLGVNMIFGSFLLYMLREYSSREYGN